MKIFTALNRKRYKNFSVVNNMTTKVFTVLNEMRRIQASLHTLVPSVQLVQISISDLDFNKLCRKS